MSGPFAGFVTVKLTVDNLKHQIMSVLPNFADDMKISMEREVEAAVRNFDFAGEVKRATEKELKEQVAYAVRRAIEDTCRDPKFRERIADAVRNQIL